MDNPIVDLSFAFALGIIEFTEILEEKKKYAIARQLLRSGTSIGANVSEAQHAESKADFIHKLKIASKEANETMYWLLLCKHANGYPESDTLVIQLGSIQKLLPKIISSSKKNL